MKLYFIGRLILRIEPYDLYCRKYYKGLRKRYPKFSESFDRAGRLLRDHFMNVGNSIGSKSLILLRSEIIEGNKLDIYKFKIAVKDLRPGQYPRLWFAHFPDRQILVPLALAVHQGGYNDSQVEHLVKQNLKDYIYTRIIPLS